MAWVIEENTLQGKQMTNYLFDDTNIKWQTLGEFEHLLYSILDIDEQNQIIDMLFKFAAHQQIVLHRHKALNKTFVIQGEHRLYEADGKLKEVRAVGSYTSSLPSDEPHREGGGDVDVIVFFSIRGNDGVLYEILDDDLNIIATLSMQDFVNLYKEQMQP
jgi:quercetin dioxygenase-like cupin family protein